jgi:hypothetical protein
LEISLLMSKKSPADHGPGAADRIPPPFFPHAF